jgi:hypothetical protein
MATRFSLWSNLRSLALRIFPYHVLLFYLAPWMVALVARIQKRVDLRWPLMPLALALSAAGMLEFAMASLTDALDIARHLFMFHVITELLILMMVAAFISRGTRRRTVVESKAVPAPAEAAAHMRLNLYVFLRLLTSLTALSVIAGGLVAAPREILLIAGPPSHTRLAHEQNAAAILYARFLNEVPGIHATVSKSGWPLDENLIAKADAIWVFCDGGEKHLIAKENHTTQMQAAADRGAGMMFYHYGVEPPDKSLHKEFLDWTGGLFELRYSVNPIFEADFASLPKHPITRGVTPFKLKDEW